MACLVNGYPQNGYATGTVPSGPTNARYPFMDNLRISRYATVRKLVTTPPAEVTVGDVVTLQDAQGEFLQFGGERIAYVIGKTTEPDGSVGLNVIPYSESLVYSQSDVPPYLQLAIDNGKMRTLVLTYEDVEGSDTRKKITALEETALDTDYLSPTGNQFVLVDGEGNESIVPYVVLKHFVLDGSFKSTILCSAQDLWTLKQNCLQGMLFYDVVVQD